MRAMDALMKAEAILDSVETENETLAAQEAVIEALDAIRVAIDSVENDE